MPDTARSLGVHQAHTIHLTPAAKDALLGQLRDAAEHLQRAGDEFALNAIDCPGHDGPRKLTLKLVTELPTLTPAPHNLIVERKTQNKDLLIASVIAAGCVALIAVAFIAPKKKSADSKTAPAPTAIVPGPESPRPVTPR